MSRGLGKHKSLDGSLMVRVDAEMENFIAENSKATGTTRSNFLRMSIIVGAPIVAKHLKAMIDEAGGLVANGMTFMATGRQHENTLDVSNCL